MTALVVDASALLEFVLRSTKGERVSDRIAAKGAIVHVPDLCPTEVVSGLRGLVLGGKLGLDRASRAAASLTQFAAKRHATHAHLGRIWNLRANLTAYDAAYVALAEVLEAPLVTTDGKFNTPQIRKLITVEVIR